MKRCLLIASICGLAACSIGGGCGSPIKPEAEKQFRGKLGTLSATVFPAYLRTGGTGGYDDAAAASLKTMLENAKLATVTVSDAHVPLTGKAGSNQAKMLRESLTEFAAWLKANPVKTDYAILPEYLIDGKGRGIGVNLCVLTADGECAYALVLNSHHEPFRKVDPQNAADCTSILVEVMRDELVQWKGEQ